MPTPSPSIRDLAERLLVATRTAPSSDPPVHEAVALCETLRLSLTRFAGADGVAALMRRALALARVEAPALNNVTLNANGHMEGLEGVADAPGGTEAAVALVAHVLALLGLLIGEPLTLSLVREGWPDASLPATLGM